MNYTLTDKQRRILVTALKNYTYACEGAELRRLAAVISVVETSEEYIDQLCWLVDLFNLNKSITVSSSQPSTD